MFEQKRQRSAAPAFQPLPLWIGSDTPPPGLIFRIYSLSLWRTVPLSGDRGPGAPAGSALRSSVTPLAPLFWGRHSPPLLRSPPILTPSPLSLSL